jgi:hypothetical protein
VPLPSGGDPGVNLWAQVKAQDLQVFVEVLLNCSEDPREILDIRTSEARLRTQVDSLQSRLDGPEYLAALGASKQSEVCRSMHGMLRLATATVDTVCWSVCWVVLLIQHGKVCLLR